MAGERFVGAGEHKVTHAVWVPHDLPEVRVPKSIDRPGRGGLSAYGGWSGLAECGAHVRGIYAGPHNGHDWDLVPNMDKCQRCERKVNADERRRSARDVPDE